MVRNIILIVFCCSFMTEIYAQTAQTNVCLNGPPKGTNPSYCCPKAQTFDKTIMENCFRRFGSNQPKVGKGISGPMNGLECVFECVMNSTRAITNDVVNPQLLVQAATRSLASSPDWIPVVTAGINYCTAQATANAAAIRNSLKGDLVNGITTCSATSAFMVGCMFTYELRNCPAKLWNQNQSNNAKCNDLKSYFNQCPTPLIN